MAFTNEQQDMAASFGKGAQSIGKTVAFTAVTKDGGFALGLAEKDEPGYWDVPGTFLAFASHDEASQAADKLNERIDLDAEQAFAIVSSSMAKSFGRTN